MPAFDHPGTREWVPTAFFLAASDDYATEIAFSPRQFMHDTTLRYTAELCVYNPSTGRPALHRSSGPIALEECYRISSEELRPHLPRNVEFFYGEAFNVADAPPKDVNVAMPSNLHYYSKSGRLQGDLGSNYIYGSPRKALKGELYFDHFPLGAGVPGMALKVFLMNPYVRPSSYRVMLTSRHRRNVVVGEGTLPGKSVSFVDADLPDAPAEDDGLAVVVGSELKLNAIYGLVVKSSGVMCGLDHGHPFLMQRLSH